MASATRPRAGLQGGFVAAVFFVSGMPAILYQLIWQRALFTFYGVNVEAVSVVVTGFLVGLGLGSLVGGWLSQLPNVRPIAAFAVIEAAIGVFGFWSLEIFDLVGKSTLHASALSTALISLALVIPPAMLMGATLPLLSAHLVRLSGNVGRSVGLLYFVNTAGSAMACFAAATLLMNALGMDGSVWLAAAINIAVAGAAALVPRNAELQSPLPAPPSLAAPSRRLAFAGLLAAATGFLALSFEIVWFRFISVATGALASTFALTLGAYLAGIACGSQIARRYCSGTSSANEEHLRALGWVLLFGAAVGYILVPAAAAASEIGRGLMLLCALVTIAVHGGLCGAAFPLIAHHGVEPDSRAGARISWIYMSNILGSAAGSLGTGFGLMEWFGLSQIVGGLTLLATGLAVTVFFLLPARRLLVGAAATVIAAIVVIGPVGGVLWARLWEHIIRADAASRSHEFVAVVENRSGVIAVDADGIVYGGGMYDGMISVDLLKNANGLHRPLSLVAFHPAPKSVLMIGLSTGAWAELIVGMPSVDQLTIIEINAGYLQLIDRHAEVRELLSNPKVRIHIDDGRRWMNKNPDAQFDAVVQNTTFHFRSNVTNLLSREYLGLVRSRLKPGGIFLYNTTGSSRAHRTACLETPHAFRYSSLMIVPAHDSVVTIDPGRLPGAIRGWHAGTRRLLDLDRGDHRDRLDSLTREMSRGSSEIEFCDAILGRTLALHPILDRNMGEEWR